MAELPPIDQHLEKEHQEKTKVKNIQCVEMGKYEVSTNCAAVGQWHGQAPVALDASWNLDTTCLVCCTLASALMPSVSDWDMSLCLSCGSLEREMLTYWCADGHMVLLTLP